MSISVNSMTISGLAKAGSVNVETIRYYQRKNLLSTPVKPVGSIRRYSEIDLARLKFIKSAQQLGFTLDEVGELLALDDGRHCSEASALAEGKIALVREKILRLQSIEQVLSDMVKRCHQESTKAKCPLIKSLYDHHELKAK